MNQYAQTVYNTAKADGMTDAVAKIITAQAGLESANFTSHIFKATNNAFGYTYDPRSIYQTGPGPVADNAAHVGAYRNLMDSVHEVTAWIKRRLRDGRGGFPKTLDQINTPEEYALALFKAGYYQGWNNDPESNIKAYKAGINTWLKNYGLALAAGGAGILLLLLGVFF